MQRKCTSDVRLHTDGRATEFARPLTRSRSRTAITSFSAPNSTARMHARKELLAHESTHVLQQRGQQELKTITAGQLSLAHRATSIYAFYP